jgi:hypothetical protein
VNRPVTGRLGVIILMALVLAACAGMANKPMAQLAVGQIVAEGMKEIDLSRNQLVCAGKKIETLDSVDGTLVRGLLCEEPEHMSFLYLFNGEPFFFAIMGINQARDELTPLMGFGALEIKGRLLPVDLNSKPSLPTWAYDSDGKIINSIYSEQEAPGAESPDMKD